MDTEAPKQPIITLSETVRVVCKHFSQRVGFIVGEGISGYIGVDKFQTIPNNNFKIGVPRLISLTSIQLRSQGIDVYTVFAGKGKFAADIYPQGCESEAFVENLHRIGDIARCAVELCQKSSKSVSVLGTDELRELAFGSAAYTSNVRSSSILSKKTLLTWSCWQV